MLASCKESLAAAFLCFSLCAERGRVLTISPSVVSLSAGFAQHTKSVSR